MDINSIPAENDKERDFDFAYNQCFYAIIKCPPAIGTPTGSLAFVTYIPEANEECGVLQCFNPEKNTARHAFHTSTKILRTKYTALKKLVIKNNQAELVWEGNPNIIKYGEIYVKHFIDGFDRFPYFIFN